MVPQSPAESDGMAQYRRRSLPQWDTACIVFGIPRKAISDSDSIRANLVIIFLMNTGRVSSGTSGTKVANSLVARETSWQGYAHERDKVRHNFVRGVRARSTTPGNVTTQSAERSLGD